MLKPTADRVLVHMRPGVQETPSGLVIPPAAQQITQTADVLACGPSVKNVTPGSLVMIDLHAGIHIEWRNNTPVLLVRESDIQAVLE